MSDVWLGLNSKEGYQKDVCLKETRLHVQIVLLGVESKSDTFINKNKLFQAV